HGTTDNRTTGPLITGRRTEIRGHRSENARPNICRMKWVDDLPHAHAPRRIRSAGRAHASCVNEFLGPMINLTTAASSIFVNVKPAVLQSCNRRGRQTDFVFYLPTVIGDLELRIIHAVKLP